MKTQKRSKKLFVFANDNLKDLVAAKPGRNLRMHYPKYAYTLHTVIHYFTHCREQYDKYGKRLNVKKFDTLFGGKYLPEIKDDLIRWGYLHVEKVAITGKHAATYKLTPKYEQAAITMRRFTRPESKFIGKLIRFEEKEQLGNRVTKRLLQTYEQHITVSEEGLRYFEIRYPHPAMVQLIQLYRSGDQSELQDTFNDLMDQISIAKEDLTLFGFLAGDFYVKNPVVSQRIYSNICNLKRDLRKFILLQGKPLMETDIACSQVVFSVPVIEKALSGQTEDFQTYTAAALSGTFYEILADSASMDITLPDDRKMFKQEFFRQIFFSKPHRYSLPIKDAFQRLFPTVYEAINKIKKGNHSKFAVQLQNLESDLINSNVLKALQDEGHVALSLHDAIYVNNPTSLHRAEELIRMAFELEYRLDIQFKNSRAKLKDAVLTQAA
ncbi:MAG: hypothetical protein EOO16_00315 [Chitinophagaceae bacterium]|nr:MAG: hypothetical protein EOO16_00315 [Chitinophagaceae bacterium]